MIDAFTIAVKELQQAKIDSPRFDASQLLSFVLGKDTSNMLQQPMKTAMVHTFFRLVDKRATGYPLQYLLGEWEFYGHKIKVGKGVLIPRPDTETLIDQLVKLKLSPQYVLDLCSGSGCIAIAAAKLFPDARIDAVELYEGAFQYLIENIALHRQTNVNAKKCDVLTFTPPQPADVILSNPPYIQTKAIPLLQTEVLFEPPEALDGKEDGLYFYREIAKRYYPFLKENGYLLFEIGFDQGDAVINILKDNQYRNIIVKKDFGQNDRVVIAQK